MACNPTLFLIILYFIFNNTNADIGVSETTTIMSENSTTVSCNFLSDIIYIFDTIILFLKNQYSFRLHRRWKFVPSIWL